jgi:hypothetical protein
MGTKNAGPNDLYCGAGLWLFYWIIFSEQSIAEKIKTKIFIYG